MISGAFPLISLHFLKSLRSIGGVDLDEHKNQGVLIIKDNANLRELFTEEVTKNLQIGRGNVIMHFNRKLCLDKINTLLQETNIPKHRQDIGENTNGDLIPCKFVLSLVFMSIAFVYSCCSIYYREKLSC